MIILIDEYETCYKEMGKADIQFKLFFILNLSFDVVIDGKGLSHAILFLLHVLLRHFLNFQKGSFTRGPHRSNSVRSLCWQRQPGCCFVFHLVGSQARVRKVFLLLSPHALALLLIPALLRSLKKKRERESVRGRENK